MDRPIKVRFHLAKGENFMKWQVTSPSGVAYYDPEHFHITMRNCKLRNRKSTEWRNEADSTLIINLLERYYAPMKSAVESNTSDIQLVLRKQNECLGFISELRQDVRTLKGGEVSEAEMEVLWLKNQLEDSKRRKEEETLREATRLRNDSVIESQVSSDEGVE